MKVLVLEQASTLMDYSASTEGEFFRATHVTIVTCKLRYLGVYLSIIWILEANKLCL